MLIAGPQLAGAVSFAVEMSLRWAPPPFAHSVWAPICLAIASVWGT